MPLNLAFVLIKIPVLSPLVGAVSSFCFFLLFFFIERAHFLDAMGVFQRAPLVCNRNQHCSEWARLYLEYCLCSAKDGVSLTLGSISVLSWGIAEVPQIITNCKEKSAEGLSIALLTTWILGDLFNVFGCMLEPTTIPTQYYMAVLYTINSVILFTQAVYYGHVYHQLKKNRQQHKAASVDKHNVSHDSGPQLVNHADECRKRPSTEVPHSSRIPVTLSPLHVRDSFYKSARFLSGSYNSAAGSSTGERTRCTINGRNSVEEPFLGGEVVAAQSAPPSNTKTMLCVVSAVTFFISNINLMLANNRFHSVLETPNQGAVIGARRTLMKESGRFSPKRGGQGSSGIGTLLGWAMAAIYMGGRLPQICLNIRRGNVEGLSLCMFILALVGNVTYIASILVNSLDWSKIQPNLPWLVDAGGCALLDTFILLQFVYFRSRAPRDQENKLANTGAA